MFRWFQDPRIRGGTSTSQNAVALPVGWDGNIGPASLPVEAQGEAGGAKGGWPVSVVEGSGPSRGAPPTRGTNVEEAASRSFQEPEEGFPPRERPGPGFSSATRFSKKDLHLTQKKTRAVGAVRHEHQS